MDYITVTRQHWLLAAEVNLLVGTCIHESRSHLYLVHFPGEFVDGSINACTMVYVDMQVNFVAKI